MSEPYVARQASHFQSEVRLYGVSGNVPRDHIDGAWTLDQYGFRYEGTMLAITGRAPSLRAELSAFSPNVVLAHFAQDAWRISGICRRLGIPLAVVVHGSDVLSKPSLWRGPVSMRQMNLGWRRFVRDVDVFLPVSNALRDVLLRRGVIASKVARHYLGVSISTLPERTGASEFDVVFVGRLVENKGLAELVQAAATRNWRVAVVGDGPLRGELEASAARSSSEFVFFGSQRHESAMGIVARSRVLCMPSVEVASGAAEGFGLAALEASGIGLPVVAYGTGGLGEAVLDGITGVVVPSGNVMGLRSALDRVLGDDRMYLELAIAGKLRTRSMFNDVDRAHELEDFLRMRYGCS